MRKHRPTNGLLRTAVAVVFGFMSLLHGPVMTFAMTGTAPVHHAMTSHTGHHHHGTALRDEVQPGERAAVPVCNAFGCLIAVEALPLRVPGAILEPIGALAPGIADAMVPADIEPAVPPPRLQV